MGSSGIYFCTLLFLFNSRFKTRPNINKNCVGTGSFFSIYFLAGIFDPVGDLNRFGIILLKVFLCLGVKFWIYFLVTSWVHNFLSIGIMFGGFDGNIFRLLILDNIATFLF